MVPVINNSEAPDKLPGMRSVAAAQCPRRHGTDRNGQPDRQRQHEKQQRSRITHSSSQLLVAEQRDVKKIDHIHQKHRHQTDRAG